MKTFLELLRESGGRKAGKLEILTTDVDTARKYAKPYIDRMPDFDKNYEFAKRMAAQGSTKRKDMPAISSKDVKKFQQRLNNGVLDIKKPFSKDTDPKNPFPEGLSGEKAKHFLENGLKKFDGNENDDIVDAKIVTLSIKKLIPIQEQIYVDVAIDDTKKYVKTPKDKFLNGGSFFITSTDNFIIDGHHRWLIGVLVDPEMKVKCLQIDLPIKVLLPLAKAYGDAIGNKRNG